jgi:hypothetical protein
MMKQNILLAAYEKPLTCVEIALALGIPTAYIEKAVADLVKSELMQQIGNKVFTDFIIRTPEQILSCLDAQIAFAQENYTSIWGYMNTYLDKLREITRTYNLAGSEQYKLEYYFLLYLFEGDILASPAQHHLVQKAIGFAGCVADTAPGSNPRLLPRNRSLFKFCNDAVGDFAVNVHFSAPSYCGEQSNVVEWICSPVRSCFVGHSPECCGRCSGFTLR